MSVTGLLLFFHLDSGFNMVAHQWVGWVMVSGVAMHVTTNWASFRRHLVANRTGRWLVGGGLALLAASFVRLPGAEGPGGDPPMLTLRAVMAAPLKDVAPLTGKSVDELLAALRKAGFAAAQPGLPLDRLVDHDRDREARILNLLFDHPPAGDMPPPR